MENQLTNKTIGEFLALTSAKEPNPGGGGVCAYSGALGVALGNMVINITQNSKKFAEIDPKVAEEMEGLKKTFNDLIETLLVNTQEDGESFSGVLEAFKLPKTNDTEKKLRSQAIQKGYVYAMEIPFQTAEVLLSAMEKMAVLVDWGDRGAITDVAIGVLLLASSIRGVLYNVTINLKSVKDPFVVEAAIDRRDHLIAEADRLKTTYLSRIDGRLS